MNIAIINSLGKEKYKKCLNSLNKTINIKNHKIFKFHEDKFRGHTLNNIIKKIGFKNDLLIVADDVSFTKGWLKIYLNTDTMLTFGVQVCFIQIQKNTG